MTNEFESLTIDTLEKLYDAKAALNALQLIADAYLLGSNAYNEHDTAEAMHRVIDAAREDIAATVNEIKAAITTSKTA